MRHSAARSSTRVRRRTRSKFLLSATPGQDFLLFASPDSHTALRARSRMFLCHFFASSQRNGERKDARTFPPGPPSAAAAGLPRRYACAGKRPARIFAIPFCLKFVLNRARSRYQKIGNRLARATSVPACNVCLFALANKQTCDFGLPKSIFYQIANAKSEFAKLRKNIGGAERRQFLRALGVLRGLPLNPLSWFILSRMRKNEHNRSASARSSVSACRRNLRSKEKAQTPLPAHTPADERAVPRR